MKNSCKILVYFVWKRGWWGFVFTQGDNVMSIKNLKSAHRPPPSIVSKEAFMCIPFAAAAAKSLQSCLTLCDPIDGSPPGSPIPGIL